VDDHRFDSWHSDDEKSTVVGSDEDGYSDEDSHDGLLRTCHDGSGSTEVCLLMAANNLYTGWRYCCPDCESVQTRSRNGLAVHSRYENVAPYYCQHCLTPLTELFDKKHDELVDVDHDVSRGNPNADRDRAKDGLRNGNEIYGGSD